MKLETSVKFIMVISPYTCQLFTEALYMTPYRSNTYYNKLKYMYIVHLMPIELTKSCKMTNL